MSTKTDTSIRVCIVAACLAANGIAHAQSDPKRGEKVFDECRACHTIDDSASAVGPSLKGIVGRKAGERDDFRYSPAMKRSNITWTRQNLDAFITDPQKLVPANRMPFSGIADAKSRADVIEYLQTLK